MKGLLLTGIARLRKLVRNSGAALAVSLFSALLPWEATLSAQAADVRFFTLEEPPTNFRKEGRIVGTTVDLVREMARRLDQQPEFEFLPPARAFLLAQNTPDSMIFTAGLTPVRIDLGFQPIGPVITRRHILFARKGANYQISDLADVVSQNLTVSGMDADWRTAFLKSEGVMVETTSEHLLNFKKLMAGRTDLWISSDIEAPSILAQASVDDPAIEVAYVFRTAPSYILASKGTSQAKLTRWRTAFADVINDETFLQRLTAKWSLELGMPFGFREEDGFFVKAVDQSDRGDD